jgi:TonB family protein
MERLERHGSIRVKVSVDANGNPTRAVAVTHSGYTDYDRSAAEWVASHWRFKPAKRSGHAVAGDVVVTVRY